MMNRESDVKNITHSVALSAKEIFGESLISVILYGSYARGDYDIESDVDIMLLVDLQKADQQDYRKKIIELSSNLSLDNDITVSIKIKDSNTFFHYKDSVPFYSNVIKDGVTIDVGT